MNKGTGKRLLAIVMALSIVMAMLPVSALGAGREEGFRDVGDGDWFRDAVDYVVSHGIFNGTSDSSVTVKFGAYRSADDHSEWWAALEEKGVRLGEVNTNSHSRQLYIKYG